MSTKISALPASAGLTLTDIFPVVDDPGGVPVTQKATFSQLATLLGTGDFVLKSGDTMTGVLVHPVGSAAAPSITFTGDLDTGIYRISANKIGLAANGVPILEASGAVFLISGSITGPSGQILGAWTADSLSATSALDCALATTLAYNNASGSLLIGNSDPDPQNPPTFIHTFSGNGNIGFFGVTPVTQQTLGVDTAGGVYTATEQGMLQRVYDAVRAYGLGT